MVSIIIPSFDQLRFYLRCNTPQRMQYWNDSRHAVHEYYTSVNDKNANNEHWENMSTKITKYKTKYKVFYTLPSGEVTCVVISYFGTKKGVPGMSVELNPSKLMQDDDVLFNAMNMLELVMEFGAAYMTDFFILSKVELAVDILAEYQDIIFINPKVLTTNNHYHADGGHYLGNMNSGSRYKVYDKSKELSDNHGVTKKYMITRIELSTNKWPNLLRGNELPPAPLSNVIVVRRSEIEQVYGATPDNVVLKGLLQWLNDGGIAQDYYIGLPGNDKTMLKSLLVPVRLHIYELLIKNWEARLHKYIDEVVKALKICNPASIYGGLAIQSE